MSIDFCHRTVKCQNKFYFKQFSFNVKRVLFKKFQFSTSKQFSSIKPIDKTLSGATSPGPE